MAFANVDMFLVLSGVTPSSATSWASVNGL